jgi:hypothetical protein
LVTHIMIRYLGIRIICWIIKSSTYRHEALHTHLTPLLLKIDSCMLELGRVESNARPAILNVPNEDNGGKLKFLRNIYRRCWIIP